MLILHLSLYYSSLILIGTVIHQQMEAMYSKVFTWTQQEELRKCNKRNKKRKIFSYHILKKEAIL